MTRDNSHQSFSVAEQNFQQMVFSEHSCCGLVPTGPKRALAVLRWRSCALRVGRHFLQQRLYTFIK